MKNWLEHIKENPKDIIPFLVACLVAVLLCWLIACGHNDRKENEIICGHYDYNNHRYLCFDVRGQLKVFHDPDCQCWTLEDN